MASTKFVVSQSKIKKWRHCRKAWSYRYIDEIEPKKKKKPLLYGSIVHEMIEAKLNGKDAFAPLEKAAKEYGKMMKEELEHYGDIIGEIRSVMTNYFEYWKKDPLKYIKSKKSGNYSEHKFQVQLHDNIYMQGTLDAVAKDKVGRVWLMDHKTTKKIPEDGWRYYDIQSAIYVKFAKALGFPEIDGVVWNYIRKKPPTVPDLLKSGELSKRSNIDTTWPVYLQAIKDNKLDPDDYKDMQEQLKGKEANFFFRTYMPINKDVVENIVNEAIMTAHEMDELQDEPTSHTRNLGYHCTYCPYFTLCQAELRNLDAKTVRKMDYKKVEDEHEEDDEEAA